MQALAKRLRRGLSHRLEIGLIALGALCVFALSAALDLGARFAAFAQTHKSFEVDELPVLLFALTVGIAIYAVRRWREAARAVRQRQELVRHFEALAAEALDMSLSKTATMSKLSHSIRTPLNAIIGFSELMKLEVIGPLGQPAYREYAQSIHESGKDLHRMVDAVLDLEKIEARARDYEDTRVDVRELVATIMDVMRPVAAAQNVQLDHEVQVRSALKADLRAVRQIVTNLLSNAIRFSPAGGAVRVLVAETPAGMAIEVADTGIGMKSAPAPAGGGEGLQTVRRLAALLDGQFEIESVPQAGTVARVRLPASRLVLPPVEEDAA